MSPRLFDDRQEADIGRLYRDGSSTRDIATLFETNHTTVRNVLRRTAVTARRHQRAVRLKAYALNREAFRAPLTPIAEYWSGFLMADGCIRDDGAIALRLQQRDRRHIEKFRSFLGSEAPIYAETAKKAVGITVCSRELADDLFKLGITPRKSLVSRACDSLAGSPAFWRGMFDGDGHIDWHVIWLVGGITLLEQWRSFARQFGQQPSLRRKLGRLFQASSNGNAMRDLASRLYRGAPEEARLDRKFPMATRLFRTMPGPPSEIRKQGEYQDMLEAGQLCFFEDQG
jgi:hypothetical protein